MSRGSWASPATSPSALPPEPQGWRRLAWDGYQYLPRSADPLLALGTRALLPITRWRVPLAILRGPAAAGRTASVLVAGTADYLVHRFFTAPPAREALASVPIWQLGDALARHRASVDLVAARLDRVSAALFLREGSVAVPEWVGAVAPVPEDPERLCQANKSLRHNLGRMRRAGFTPIDSHDPRDFDEFYARMYLPFIRERHGAESMASNRARMRRCFRQGGLLFVERDGRRVAGVIYRVRGRMFDLVVIGTAGGDLGPLHDGAAFALDLFAFEHARARGCTHFDFGGSRPSPLDGLLQYKARWQSEVVLSRTLFYELHLQWDHLTPAVLGFLATTPLLFRQADGLAALWASTPSAPPDFAAAREVLRRLRRLYVLDATGGACALPADLPAIRVDAAADPAWRPPARAQT